MRYRTLSVLLLALLVVGCSQRTGPAPDALLPEVPAQPPMDQAQFHNWCEAHWSPRLRQLTLQALENNHELAAAWPWMTPWWKVAAAGSGLSC